MVVLFSVDTIPVPDYSERELDSFSKLPMHAQNTLHPILQQLTIWDTVLIIATVATARFLTALIKSSFTASAGRATAAWRIRILRWMPIARLSIVFAATGFIASILIVPSWENIVGIVAGAALVLAFALKDYGSSLLAGLAAIFERTYQPGDWIEIDGAYGEVRSIGMRAVRLVTLDDTEVIIPHSAIWHSPTFNATSGQHSVLCVANFYLHPEHNGLLVRERLIDLALTSPFALPGGSIKVIAAEEPWGTHYRLKAYAKDSRDQKTFTTDLTLRSKDIFRELEIKPAYAPVAVTR